MEASAQKFFGTAMGTAAYLFLDILHAELTSMLDHLSLDEMEAVLKPAMQKLRGEVVARRVYHEAPNDVFELIMSKFTQLRGEGGFKRVVESCTTRLSKIRTRLSSYLYH